DLNLPELYEWAGLVVGRVETLPAGFRIRFQDNLSKIRTKRPRDPRPVIIRQGRIRTQRIKDTLHRLNRRLRKIQALTIDSRGHLNGFPGTPLHLRDNSIYRHDESSTCER